ncbi:glycosyltransferase [Leptolyngbya sp. NIES-2104]|uniref:glycosyltransferase n=1 Tax=Leptolyngbya sp. NIES-2104 TaxID=1552121 RepID=UPI0006EC7269|nr:glycosyltransferase [Leptolyngbya sp. NIES-2104]GAP97594.1 transcriptional regulator [Leptolyngbya sp. NIES-2104]
MLTHPLKSSLNPENSIRRLMVFSNGVGGHHPVYLRHLIDYWCKEKLVGELNFVVSPLMLEQHRDMICPPEASDHNIRYYAIDAGEHTAIVQQKSLLLKAWMEWKIINRYIKQLNADHCFLTAIDPFQALLAIGLNPSCSMSGIYLRPSFHYQNFEGYVSSWKERIKSIRQKQILSRVLQHSKVSHIFCLDPYAVEASQSNANSSKMQVLPDPIPKFVQDHSEQIDDLRRETLKIEQERCVFLLFGAIDRRKGIHQILEAIQQLPPEAARKLCLLVVGKVAPAERTFVETEICKIQAQQVQVVIDDQYVSELKVRQYFELSDVVLATYQKHVGMSGILLIAAALKKPALCTNYGLMGELTRQYELGITVDASCSNAIAQSMMRFLSSYPAPVIHLTKSQALVQQHQTEKFAAKIFSEIGVREPTR